MLNSHEDIWLATNLFHINEYNLYCSGVRLPLAISGVISIYDGLIASWASCIFFLLLYTLSCSGTYSAP